MLVLSRKKDQSILIGDGIVVHICQVKGSTVRIGIEAPNNVRVVRGELPNWNLPGAPVQGSTENPAASIENNV